MITSKDNEKLKLIRRLAARKHREREGLFATEGEDLYAAGIKAGRDPAFVLSAADAGLEGEEVERDLLDSVSTLGSGSRLIAVWPLSVAAAATRPVCVYLHGLADPGNVGTVIRTTHALAGGSVVLGPECADPHSPKAVRASMGSIFAVEVVRGGLESTPEPRIAMVAHGGEAPHGHRTPVTVCLGAERDGLPADLVASCVERWTIPLHSAGAESLNVAAAAAIALERIGSAATREGRDEHA